MSETHLQYFIIATSEWLEQRGQRHQPTNNNSDKTNNESENEAMITMKKIMLQQNSFVQTTTPSMF